MKYTKSKFVDKKIEKDMMIIVKEIKKRIPGVLSIILTGGFSRGEGAVKKIKGKWVPYNDYDIQIISNIKINKEEIDEIATAISKKLGYRGIELFYPFKKDEQKITNNFYIDLKCDTLDELKKLLPRIRTIELKNNSVILYGKDLRCLIPNYKIENLPLAEGAKLLLDRMSQMIEYYSVEGKYEKEVLTYFIQQAYAAICTSLLLLNKKYQIGYEKSMKIFKENYKKDFPELYKKLPILDKKIEQFIKWKITPYESMNDVEKEWFIARTNILEVSKYFFSKFLGRRIENEVQLAKEIYKMRKKFYLDYLNEMMKQKIGFSFGAKFLLPCISLVLKYKYYKRLKKIQIDKISVLFGKSPDLVIFSSLIFFIGAISQTGINKEMLQKGKKILSMVYPVTGENWEDITLDYANAYIAFFMMKI